MIRLVIACGLFIVGIAVAAYADDTHGSGAQSPGYFIESGAPLVAPYNQDSSSDATAQKQKNSGYYPTADAPLVAPDVGNAGANATASKQSESGYFPTADAPLVAPTTTGAR